MVTKAATDGGVDTLQQQVSTLMAELTAVQEERDSLRQLQNEPLPDMNIVQRLALASARIGAVGKDAVMNDGPKYPYRSIEAILERAQGVFAALQIVPSARILERTVEKVPRGRDNTLWNHVCLHVEWKFTAPDGSFITTEMWGEGLDNGDKGSNKAKTASRKYALIDVLNLAEKGADPDDYSPPEQYTNGGTALTPAPAVASGEQMTAMVEGAKRLSAEQKQALRAFCEDNGLERPTKDADGGWIRPPAGHAEAILTWMAQQPDEPPVARAQRADTDPNADPNADPPHPTTEEPQVPPQSITELRDQMAQVRRDGTTAAQAGPQPDGGPTVPPVEPAATAGPVDDDPPPRSDWVELRCTGNPQHDVRGYEGMQCPKQGCPGLLSNEEPF